MLDSDPVPGPASKEGEIAAAGGGSIDGITRVAKTASNRVTKHRYAKRYHEGT